MDIYTNFDPPSGLHGPIQPSRKHSRRRPELKMDYDKPQHFGMQLGDLTQDQIRRDLDSMGFTKTRVEVVMKREEPIVDGFAQIPSYGSSFALQDSSLRLKTNMPWKKMVGTTSLRSSYKHLIVDSSRPHWVLFDINVPLSDYDVRSLSKSFAQWQHYKPGNQRILKFNTFSGSFGLQWTPVHFQDHGIDYTADGPRLVAVSSAVNAVETGHKSGRAAKPRASYAIKGTSETSSTYSTPDSNHSLPMSKKWHLPGLPDDKGKKSAALPQPGTKKLRLKRKAVDEDDTASNKHRRVESGMTVKLSHNGVWDLTEQTDGDTALVKAASTNKSNAIFIGEANTASGKLQRPHQHRERTEKDIDEQYYHRLPSKQALDTDTSQQVKPQIAPSKLKPLEDNIQVAVRR